MHAPSNLLAITQFCITPYVTNLPHGQNDWQNDKLALQF
jgi:hypothetical protein